MYLGVDIGTSGVKVSLVDRFGEALATAYRKFRIHGLEQDLRELDPAEMAEGAKSAIREVAAKSGRNAFDLILVSSLGEAIVPTDASGTALSRCIMGSDRRGAEELEHVLGLVPPLRLAEITGLNPSNIYSLNKILHLRRHKPDLFRKVWKFFCVTDYFVYLLTGETVIDYSMASRTMAFDIGAGTWSNDILNAVGVDPGVLSTPVPTGTVAGPITAAVAAELGLAPGTPVAIGAHDHIFNALGVGAVGAGDVSNAIGTTEGLTAILGGKMQPAAIVDNNISCEPFVGAGLYNTVAWHNTAGAMVNWFLDMFHGRERTPEQTAAYLGELNRACGTGPGRLVAVPHFSGSTARHMDAGAKGGIVGLTLGTSREDIFRALIEGACYECRVILDALAQSGIPVRTLRVTGGGSHSPVWLQAKADIIDMPILVGAASDSGPLGAAVLASVVCRHHADLNEAAKAMVKPGRVVEPIAKHVAVYNERYREYRSLYEKLRGVNHLL